MTINRRHWSFAIMIDQLICASFICFLNHIWSFPFSFKFPTDFMCNYDWSPKN